MCDQRQHHQFTCVFSMEDSKSLPPSISLYLSSAVPVTRTATHFMINCLTALLFVANGSLTASTAVTVPFHSGCEKRVASLLKVYWVRV